MKIDNEKLNQKIKLIQWLSSLEDRNIIDKLLQFRKAKTIGWWETPQGQEKDAILKGIKDAENNKLSLHSSVRKLYEKWL